MAKSTEFGGSGSRYNAIDRFEKRVIKIMLTAAKAALDAEGIKYKVSPQGEIRVTEQYLEEERWTSHFRFETWANHV